jgi:hypothetical protein
MPTSISACPIINSSNTGLDQNGILYADLNNGRTVTDHNVIPVGRLLVGEFKFFSNIFFEMNDVRSNIQVSRVANSPIVCCAFWLIRQVNSRCLA